MSDDLAAAVAALTARMDDLERLHREFVDAMELREADNVHRFEERVAIIDDRVGQMRDQLSDFFG